MTLSITKYRSHVLDSWLASRQGGPSRAGVQAVLPENGALSNLTVDQLASMLGASTLTAAGVAVTPEIALRVSAVYACVSLVAGAVSSLPLPIYERGEEDARRRAKHDYWWFLNEQANEDCTAAAAMEYIVASKLFYGDGFARLLRPNPFTNRVIGWMPLHPSRVEPFRDGGMLLYRVTERDGKQTVYDKSDILHFPSLGFDGLRSPSPITYAARESIGTGLAAEEYSARFYSQGSTHDIALKSAKGLTPEQGEVLRASYLAKYGGGKNSRVPLILTGGLEVEKLSITPHDASLLPTRQFTVEEICRVIGVPPFMVGATDKQSSWGTGVSVMGKGFVRFTLRTRHLTPIQQELNRKLWPNRERYFVEFNTNALERDDTKTRFESYRIALGRAGEPGFMTANEARRLENMEPITGGDALHSGEKPKEDDDDPEPAETPSR